MLDEPTDPGRASWHHGLGRLHAERRQWRDAVAAFTHAAALQPDRAVRHYWLARAKELSFDFVGAQESYTTALRLDPSRSGWARRLAGVVEAAAGFEPFAGTLVAHRGRVRGQPENAIESLAGLPAFVGAVEVDVRLTRDRVPVLMHDRRVDRTTVGEGEVAEFRYRRLPALRGTGGVVPTPAVPAPAAATSAVPTLDAYLTACADRGIRLILIDVKPPGAADRSALAAITRVVRESPVAESCVLLVREEQELALARRVAGDRARLGCFGTVAGDAIARVRAARQHRAELLLVAPGSRRYLENRQVVAQVRAAGLTPGASTINSRRALDAARVDGCGVIMTDLCDQLAHFTGKESG